MNLRLAIDCLDFCLRAANRIPTLNNPENYRRAIRRREPAITRGISELEHYINCKPDSRPAEQLKSLLVRMQVDLAYCLEM